ncbi:hypothetical protein BAE36_14770 [Rhizobium leguminosarum bv. trifolii]|nr:hypothetical protein BAE36_14770 [Rhizobium leguminosarum bv. trifolii]
MIEHRRQDIGQQTKLADLSDRQRQRDRNRLLGPTECNETLDAPPLVDRIEGLARDVFDHRSHRAIVVGRLDDDNIDFLDAGGDGHARAPVARFDDIAVAAGFGENDGRLDDADSLDGRKQQRVGLGRRLRLTSIVGIVLQRTRIDFHELHGNVPFSGDADAAFCRSFLSSFFSEDTSRTAKRPDRRNCGRAALPRRISGANSHAKDEWPGCGVPRLSASGGGRTDLRPVFLPFPLLLSQLLLISALLQSSESGLSGNKKMGRRKNRGP